MISLRQIACVLGFSLGIANSGCGDKKESVPPVCEQTSYSQERFDGAFKSAVEKLTRQGYEVRSGVWENEEKFNALANYMIEDLNCTPQASAQQALRSSGMCEKVNVSSSDSYGSSIYYCGPGAVAGNDCFRSKAGDCLNEVCYAHDLCYDDLRKASEEGAICLWSAETESCDEDFLDGYKACLNDLDCGFWCNVTVAIAGGLSAIEDTYNAAGPGCLWKEDEEKDLCKNVTCDSPLSECYTLPGTCLEGLCEYAFVDGVACDDANASTIDDVCLSGVCTGTQTAWTPTSTEGAPSPRWGHSAIWTGEEMIIWGGLIGEGATNTGAKYNANTDTWTIINTESAPQPRFKHTAVWTGNEMIIWGGGLYGGGVTKTGGRYNPWEDSWEPTSLTNAPSARTWHSAIWTGSQMVVWGGSGTFNFYPENGIATGGRYDPSTDMWTSVSNQLAPGKRIGHSAVWTGEEMIIWGGVRDNEGLSESLKTGGRYNPSTNSWSGMASGLSERHRHSAVWTGNEMFVWTGYCDLEGWTCPAPTGAGGGRYNPATNSWVGVPGSIELKGLRDYAIVWTGIEVIVWGGNPENPSIFTFNNGGKYSPTSDVWTTIPTDNVPEARTGHTGVWTGEEMIIWGGKNYSGKDNNLFLLNNGGKYKP